MRKPKSRHRTLDWTELVLVALGIAVIGMHVVLAITQSVGRWDNISCAAAWVAVIVWIIVARGWRRRAAEWRKLVEGP